MSATAQPALERVAVLLCTYQGAPFLASQLESIERQTHGSWRVFASDDGSMDDTLLTLHRYQRRWSADRLTVARGPKRGFVANFLALICDLNIQADYFAYADQDDLWEADKLERAVRWLRTIPAQIPALYCSRTTLIDEAEREIGASPRFSKPATFANALMQNIAGGNTMVFNAAARVLLAEAGADISLAAHDWWTYLVVTGCGGRVYYYALPTVRYRQHGSNAIGSSGSWNDRLRRFGQMWKGRQQRWNTDHIAALRRIRHRLTPEHRAQLDYFIDARHSGFVGRLLGLWRCGAYRQTWLGNVGMLAAAVLGRI